MNNVLGPDPITKNFPYTTGKLCTTRGLVHGNMKHWRVVVRSTIPLCHMAWPAVQRKFLTIGFSFVAFSEIRFWNLGTSMQNSKCLEQKETWDLILHVQFLKNQICLWKWWQYSHAWASCLLFSFIVVLSFTKRTGKDLSP